MEIILAEAGAWYKTKYKNLTGFVMKKYVSVGQSVSRGEAIGSVGSTGWSTGFHCHFEVRINGSTVDPTGYLY